MKTLAEALEKEQKRVSELVLMYESAGGFMSLLTVPMRQALNHADEAVALGGELSMLKAYQELKEFE